MSHKVFYTAFAIFVGIPLAISYIRWFIHNFREESEATEAETADEWADRQI